MIVGLYGESTLKSALIDYLCEKSFYRRGNKELSGLDADKNYVVDLLNEDGNVAAWKNKHAILISIGVDGNYPFEPDGIIDVNSPRSEAQEQLNRYVMKFVSKQRPDWDEYFMKIAQVASMRSNCIKRKVGAVIVRDRRIVSTGYNGTPRGTKNCNEGGCPRCNSLASSGTRLDECLCSHAEENAITQSAYHGTSVKDGCIYTTFAPCLMCSKMIINSGIVEVVFNVEYPLNDTSFQLFEQAGVKIRQHRLTEGLNTARAPS